MKWMETLRVQTAGNRKGDAGQELSALVQDVHKSRECEGLMDLLLYSHGSMPGFFAIHLFWDTECCQIRGSLPGLSLAQTLKSFGMVDHSVWVEKKGDQAYRDFGIQRF